MARNLSFDPDTMFDDLDKKRQVEVKEEDEAPVEKPIDKIQAIREELEGTQGRKGMKNPRIHLSVTKDNEEYLKLESRRRGISRTLLLNEIIAKYAESPEGHIEL